MRKRKVIENNKKARHDYFLDEIIECGIVLTGTEIKSLRAGGVSLRDSFARVDNGEVFVYNMHISPYKEGNRYNADPLRPKKLLLHKQQIRKLSAAVMRQGVTLIPVQVFLNERGRAKLDLAVARGKKLYDKREDIAKRDAQRNIERSFKQDRY
jgi:SsrA-binding protein